MSLEWLTCVTFDTGWGGISHPELRLRYQAQDVWQVNPWWNSNEVVVNPARTGKGLLARTPSSPAAVTYTGHIVTRSKAYVGWVVAMKHPGGTLYSTAQQNDDYIVCPLDDDSSGTQKLALGYRLRGKVGAWGTEGALTTIAWGLYRLGTGDSHIETLLTGPDVSVATPWTLLTAWTRVSDSNTDFYYQPDGGSEVNVGNITPGLTVAVDGKFRYNHKFIGGKGSNQALDAYIDDLASCHGDAVGDRPSQGTDTLHGKAAGPVSGNSPHFDDLDASSLPEHVRITRLTTATGTIEAKCEDAAFNAFALSDQTTSDPTYGQYNAESRSFDKTPDDVQDPWDLARFNALQAQMQGSDHTGLVAQVFGRNLTVIPGEAPPAAARRIFITHC